MSRFLIKSHLEYFKVIWATNCRLIYVTDWRKSRKFLCFMSCHLQYFLMLISSSASKKCKWHIKSMRNILQPLRPPTTHVTLVQQTIADISKYSSNHLFIVILNETLWLWLFSSCFCFVHLGSHFAHLLWFCPKLGLCWFRWMPSGEICMHKGGQWRGFFCTALHY